MKESISMRSGLLDTEVKILRPEITRNAFGEQEEEYKDHYTTKARVLHNSGRRSVENGEILHSYEKTVEVWKYVDVVETDFILLDGKQYRILSIEPDKVQQKQIITIELIND